MQDSADSSKKMKVWYGAFTRFHCQEMTNENLSFPLLSLDINDSWIGWQQPVSCDITSQGIWVLKFKYHKQPFTKTVSVRGHQLYWWDAALLLTFCNKASGCVCARMRGRARCVHVSINTQTFLLTSRTAKYYPSISCGVFFKRGCLSHRHPACYSQQSSGHVRFLTSPSVWLCPVSYIKATLTGRVCRPLGSPENVLLLFSTKHSVNICSAVCLHLPCLRKSCRS